MPIKQELRKFYGREWRTVTRPRILQRAGDKCERCGAPNNADVIRACGFWLDQRVTWVQRVIERWRDRTGAIYFGGYSASGQALLPPALESKIHTVRIVLTIAHLNHVPGDDREENLAALCQWCHLNHDKTHHRETRATRKDQGRPLIAAADSIAV